MHALKVAKFQFILERDLNRHMTAKIIHLKIILKAFSHTLTDWRKLLRFKNTSRTENTQWMEYVYMYNRIV